MRVKILNVKPARAWQRWEVFLDVKKSKVKDHKRLLRFITAGLCPSLCKACGLLGENMRRGYKGKTWKVRKESDHTVRSKTRAKNKTSCVIMALDHFFIWFIWQNLRKRENKRRRYFAADHEQTINNLPRRAFFARPTTFNQGANFTGL